MYKTALLTGASGGMGHVIGTALLDAGYHLIMVARRESPAAAFTLSLWQDRYGKDRVCLIPCNLAEPAQVMALAQSVKEFLATQGNAGQPLGLDLLINNAGILCSRLQTNSLGQEMHWAVNCLAPALLCRQLFPLLHPGSRVINSVSCTVWIGKIRGYAPYTIPGVGQATREEPPMDSESAAKIFAPRKGHENRFTRYSDSKLGLFLYSCHLADAWLSRGITVNCADPGVVDTRIIHLNNKFIDPLCDLFFRPLIKRPAQGAATAIQLALQDPAPRTRGFYRNTHRVKMPARMEHHPLQGVVVSAVDTLLNNLTANCQPAYSRQAGSE